MLFTIVITFAVTCARAAPTRHDEHKRIEVHRNGDFEEEKAPAIKEKRKLMRTKLTKSASSASSVRKGPTSSTINPSRVIAGNNGASPKAATCDPTLWSYLDNGVICDGTTSQRSPARACMALARFGGSVTNCKTFCEIQQGGILRCKAAYTDTGHWSQLSGWLDDTCVGGNNMQDIGCEYVSSSSDDLCECEVMQAAIPTPMASPASSPTASPTESPTASPTQVTPQTPTPPFPLADLNPDTGGPRRRSGVRRRYGHGIMIGLGGSQHKNNYTADWIFANRPEWVKTTRCKDLQCEECDCNRSASCDNCWYGSNSRNMATMKLDATSSFDTFSMHIHSDCNNELLQLHLAALPMTTGTDGFFSGGELKMYHDDTEVPMNCSEYYCQVTKPTGVKEVKFTWIRSSATATAHKQIRLQIRNPADQFIDCQDNQVCMSEFSDASSIAFRKNNAFQRQCLENNGLPTNHDHHDVCNNWLNCLSLGGMGMQSKLIMMFRAAKVLTTSSSSLVEPGTAARASVIRHGESDSSRRLFVCTESSSHSCHCPPLDDILGFECDCYKGWWGQCESMVHDTTAFEKCLTGVACKFTDAHVCKSWKDEYCTDSVLELHHNNGSLQQQTKEESSDAKQHTSLLKQLEQRSSVAEKSQSDRALEESLTGKEMC